MANKLAKTLMNREVIALACGAMIGWSWVLLTGEWLTRAGTMGTVIAFAVGSGIVLLISLTYAELASAMPKAGGEHHYTHRALGYTASLLPVGRLLLLMSPCVCSNQRPCQRR